jgi:hypothetical protein
MQELAKVTTGEIGVREQLALLRLTPEDLIEAMRFGEGHRALCTPDDPRSFPGVTSWARTVRGLRIGRLRRDGWTPNDSGNYSTLVNPDQSLAIAVVTGDEQTGIYDPATPLLFPRLKYPKGNMTQQAVERNSLMPYLFPEMAEDAKAKQAKEEAAANRITWMLVRRRSGDTLYCELSLPWEFVDGHVASWKHRIILSPLDVEPMLDMLDDSGNDSGDVIDVPVQRKSNP